MIAHLRRCATLVAVLALVLFDIQRAQGQHGRHRGLFFDQGSHNVWENSIDSEKVKAAFLRGRVGLPPDLEKLVPNLANEFQKQFPNSDRRSAESAVRKMLSDPLLQRFSPDTRDQFIRKALANPDFKKQIQDRMNKARKSDPDPLPGTRPMLPNDRTPTDPSTPKDREFTIPPFDSKTPIPRPNVEPTPPRIDPKDIVPDRPKTPPDLEPKPELQNLPRNPGDTPPPDKPELKLPDLEAQPRTNPLGDAFSDPAEFAQPSPEEASRQKARQAAAAMWERNIGPLDETPVVKRALFDLVEGSDGLTDSDGNNFWDMITKESGESTSFADWVNQSANGDSWKMPSWEFPSWGFGPSLSRLGDGSDSSSGESWWSRRSSRSSSSSRSGSGFDMGTPSFGGSWLPVVLLAVVLLGGLLVWKYVYFRERKMQTVFDRDVRGSWPVDPRTLATRDDIVKAFEYLSVMICGPAARMWTHHTIAAALANLATTHSEPAMILARLYELARYTPQDEPLTAREIEEARALVCRLAGVVYP